MENQMEVALPCPYFPFPEEVWENILEGLEDSRDIQNVFRTFPELEGRIMKNRNWWLIDQTLLHIIPWLRNNDILATRRVCWRWLRAVDTLIENHPYTRAYDHDVGPRERVWIPEGSLMAHFNQLPDHFRGVSGFFGLEKFRKFYLDMDKHSPERNPFVGRDSFITDKYLGAPNQDITAFWNGATEFLQKFGSHIWFISIESTRMEDPLELWKLLHELLTSLPNLKNLELSLECSGNGIMDSGEFESFLESSFESLPPLSQLESLEFVTSSSAPELVNFVTRLCSKQIRRLLMRHQFWRTGYGNILPKLTELTLTDVFPVREVSNILLTLDAPGLHRLELSSGDVLSDLVLEEQILQPLIRFPRFRSLLINLYSDEKPGQGNPESSQDVVQLSSVEYLKINQGHLSMALLKHFPLLKYMKVFNGNWNYINSSRMMRVDVWECLPKLREITIWRRYTYEEGRPIFHYTRSKYVLWKERKSRGQLGPNLEGVFECFDLMIVGVWGIGEE